MEKKKLMTILALSSVPALAFSVSFRTAVGLGIYTVAAVLLTALIAWPLKKLVSPRSGAVTSLLVSVTVVSALMMVLEAFRGEIYSGNGIYFALNSVSALVLASLTDEGELSYQKTLTLSAARAAEWLVLTAVTAFFRELLGSASLMGNEVSFLMPYRITLLTKPFGGFLVYALVLALVVRFDAKEESK